MEQDFHSSSGRLLGLRGISLSGSECMTYSPMAKSLRIYMYLIIKSFNISKFKYSLLFKVLKRFLFLLHYLKVRLYKGSIYLM